MKVKKFFSQLFRATSKSSLSVSDKAFQKKINRIVRRQIKDVDVYKAAFSLRNRQKKLSKNHERLEFLGDAILGAIMSSYLYQVYPNENEGYLTQMKAKVVSRENLNRLGEELELKELISAKHKKGNLSNHIDGNLFEALIGAIYLDFGYDICEKIVLENLLTPEKINRLENKIASYKGLILEWGQKNKHQVRFKTQREEHVKENNFFKCEIFLNEEKIVHAVGFSKKKAEEKAAQRAFYTLNTKYKILEEG